MGKQVVSMDSQSREYLEKVRIMTDLIKAINLLSEEDITKVIQYVITLSDKNEEIQGEN